MTVTAPGFAFNAVLKDEALPELIRISQELREEHAEPAPPLAGAGVTAVVPGIPSVDQMSLDQIRETLKAQGAAELLNRVGWKNYPEKILLLGAWHEARGGTVPWRSSDMTATFSQAKEKPPANFPRDIYQAIKAGWVHAETPRTYAVTRTGWNKIAEALTKPLTA